MKLIHYTSNLIPLCKRLHQEITYKGIRLQICGAIRRGSTTATSIDLVVSDLRGSLEAIQQTGLYVWFLRGADQKAALVTIESVSVLIVEAPPVCWGAVVLERTGDHYYIKWIRGQAKKQFMKLTNKGLFDQGLRIAGETEEGIYLKLGLPFAPPKARNLWKGQKQWK